MSKVLEAMKKNVKKGVEVSELKGFDKLTKVPDADISPTPPTEEAMKTHSKFGKLLKMIKGNK